MVCTAKDLEEWKDFPKGLRILLLDGDSSSAAEIRSKLEAMDYIVSTFCNENEALSAISSQSKGFHVAIVEVTTSSNEGSFIFLENAKDLPTIMTSNNHCLNTMMKCIARGAVEFLSKPLSEDKLRNIWQHVVHKAFSAGVNVPSETLKPVKESVESILQLQADNGNRMSIDIDKTSKFSDNDHEQSIGSDKYPAPSTPQLKLGARLLDDGDCQEQANCSTDKESGELEGESKSVETTCETANAEDAVSLKKPEKTSTKQEKDFAVCSKNENTVSPPSCSRKVLSNIDSSIAASPNEVRVLGDLCEVQVNRKKLKVDWTPELHKKFLQAVEQLGVDQAIPSRILELMKVDGLTRHNVASHLQKYRMHQRHILPKEEDRKWPQQRGPMQGGYFLQRPIMAFPSNHSSPLLSSAPLYPMWGQSGVQMWGSPCYPVWQPTESWHWKPLPGMQADAWGCPVLPPTQANCFSFSQNYRSSVTQSSIELHPEEEVIERVVKEATSKPWLPLPLGLKPPSTDSVLAGLSRQGISKMPPCGSSRGSNSS